jgi:hypothetical protein
VLTNWAPNRCAGSCVAPRVKFYVAGYAADRRYAPALASRANGENEYDFSEALRLVDEEYLQRLLRETERTVAARWAAVEAVAAALLERGFLLPMDLRRIIINSR